MNLQGRTILVTRPAGQADTLKALLDQHGAEVRLLPMLAIEPLAADEPALQAARACFRQLANYQHIIFISTNAVEHGLRVFQHLGQPWPASPVVYAIGRATAMALQAAGIAAEAAAGRMDSEALLSLPGLQSVTGQRVLVVRGAGGRSQLADTLVARGAHVDIAESYRRTCPRYDDATVQQAFSPTPDAIVVNSGETLKNLAVYVQGMASIRPVVMVVPSQRVARLAGSLGFTQVVVAANARDESIVQALQVWRDGGVDESVK